MLALPLSAGDWTAADGRQGGIRNAGAGVAVRGTPAVSTAAAPGAQAAGAGPPSAFGAPVLGWGVALRLLWAHGEWETESSFQGGESTGFQRSRKVSSAQQHHPLLLFTFSLQTSFYI